MWRQGSFALAFAVLAIVSVSARTDDSLDLAIAKSMVDGVRGAEHKLKMRIVWPESAETPPPEGAEVTLITGDHDALTRLVWHDGRVEAGALFFPRNAPDWSARAFDVDAAAFARSWAAARFIAGAHDERVEPEPWEHPQGSEVMGAGSHTPARWIQLRVGGAGVPIASCADESVAINWEQVKEWSSIRNETLFQCFASYVPKANAGRTVALSEWTSRFEGEIARATKRLDLTYGGEHRLLEFGLRFMWMHGDAPALEAVDGLAKSIAARDQGDHVVERLRYYVVPAVTTLRLTFEWDSSLAADVVRHGDRWPPDFVKRTRRRFVEEDAAAYLAVLVEVTGDAAADAVDRTQVIARLRGTPAAKDAAERLRRLFGHDDLRIRLRAARTALDLDVERAAAAATFVSVVDDRSLGGGAPRIDALNEAVNRELLEPKDLRARFVDSRPDDAHFVEALLDASARTPAPATGDEIRATWRRVLEWPLEFDVGVAVDALLDLRDFESRPSIKAAIDRMAAATKGPACPRCVYPALVERLRRRLPDATWETPPLK